MLINPLNVQKQSLDASNLKRAGNPRISFAQNDDKFTTSLSQERQQLVDALNEAEKQGNNGIYYRTVYNGSPVIVKIPQGRPQIIPAFEQIYANGKWICIGAQQKYQEIEREAGAFQAVKPLKLQDCRELIDFFGYKDKKYLVTSLVEGNYCDVNSNPLTQSQLSKMMEHCSSLDKAGLDHKNLKRTNFLTSGDKVGIIDFACINPTHNPVYMSLYEHPGHSCNPYYNIISNVSNFEYQTLHPYLMELAKEKSPEESKEFFTGYLKLKSNYHQEMGNFYEEISKNQKTEENKAVFEQASKYERCMSKLLKEPGDDIVEAELLKLHLRQTTQFYRTGNKERQDITLEQFKSVHDEYLSRINELAAKHCNDPERSDYYIACKKFFSSMDEISGQECIPFFKDIEDVSKVLLGKLPIQEVAPVKQAAETLKTASKELPKTKIVVIGVALAAGITGIIYLLKRKAPQEVFITAKEKDTNKKEDPQSFHTLAVRDQNPVFVRFSKSL